MSWVRLDDQFPDHPKILAAGGDAAWLYVAGLCYCQAKITDGNIPAAIVSRLTDRKAPMKLAARLVEVGLWEPTADGFAVHDYHAMNDSAEQVKAKKEAARNRVSEWRKKQAGNAVGNATGNGVGNGVRTSTPSPSPSSPEKQKPVAREDRVEEPEPAKPIPSSPRFSADDFAETWRLSTDGKPAGNLHDNAAAAKLLTDAALHRHVEPRFFAPRVIAAHLADLEAARKRGKHHGAPTVNAFAQGPIGNPGGWFSQALQRLDGGDSDRDADRLPSAAEVMGKIRREAGMPT